MLEKYNRYKVLKIFLDSPTESFRIRELSRLSRISPPSLMNYLKEFEKQGLVRRYEKRGIPFYKAECDNERFKFYKKLSILFELESCGLVVFLWDSLSPDAIILYGSYAKGESVEGSDIDLLVVSKEKPADLEKFEKKLGKKIHLLFQENVKAIPKELKNNVINGIVLKGYLKLF